MLIRGKIKLVLYHGACCSKLDKEQIEGISVDGALRHYIQENIPVNGSCEVAVYKDEKWIGDFYLSKSIRCDVSLQKEPNKLNINIEE